MTTRQYNERQQFRSVRVAAVQAESEFLDLDGTTDKAIALIERAGSAGADLIGFPEAFVPTFPNWYETLGEGPKARSLDKELFKNSVEVPGPHIDAIADACGRAGINAVVGINERRNGTTGTMWNTQVHINRSGTIVGKHQKYVPTVGERMVHTPGGTGYVNSFDTDFGTVSALICGENANPLAQYAACIDYPVIHIASWPAYFNSGFPFPMSQSIRVTGPGVAYSLKSFVVASVTRVSLNYIDRVADSDEIREFLLQQREMKLGGLIFDPNGNIIADGTSSEDELLIADLNLEDVIIPKVVHDFAGHYNRPEIFAPIFKPEV